METLLFNQNVTQLPDILLIGGGGHCKSVIDVIELTKQFIIAGIIERDEKLVGRTVLNYPVIGCDNDLERLRGKYEYAFVTIGQIKTPEPRIRMFNLLKSLDYTLPVIVSPIAYVSRHAVIGEGTVIMHYALINAGARIGRNCIINSKALIEHDAVVEDNCHISTGAIVNGGTIIRENTFLGSNSIAGQYIEIESNSVVGAGRSILR